MQNPEEISRNKIINFSTSPEYNVAILPSENNSSDAALPDSRPHTHNTSTGSYHSHPLITGEDYYNFG